MCAQSVDKKNKPAELALLCIRTVIAQWSSRIGVEEEYIEKGKKRKEKGARSTDAVQLRVVGPSEVQLALVRFAIKVRVPCCCPCDDPVVFRRVAGV